MNMLPLTAYAQLGLSFFLLELTAYDAVMTTVAGEDKQTVSPRTINGCVDPTGGKRMEMIFGGSVTDGDIMIITEDTLYIDDQYATGSRNPQSFVSYGGLNYRVMESNEWQAQAGVTIYRASRHVAQDTI